MNGREGVADYLSAERDGVPAGEVVEAVEVQDEERPGRDGRPLEELRDDDGALIQGGEPEVQTLPSPRS